MSDPHAPPRPLARNGGTWSTDWPELNGSRGRGDDPAEPVNPFREDTEEYEAWERQEAVERERRIRKAIEREAQVLRIRRAAKRLVDAEEAEAAKPDPVEPLEWTTFLAEEITPPDWISGRLMATGQHIALIGDGKAGKSLLILDAAWRWAAGLPFLSDRPTRPLRILYVDQENGRDDIQDRLRSFGATAEQLANLIYLPFPPYRPLDTEQGAADLLADVERYKPDLVVFDTISRMVAGEENSSDPWRAFYRLCLKPMKAKGIGSVRLDHFGKDTSRGGRGSSAKTQDIDAVWELKVADAEKNILTLTRTFTRRGLGRGFYRVQRNAEQVADQWRPGGTSHTLADAPAGGAPGSGEFIHASLIADQLTAAGIPADTSRPKLRAAIREKGLTVQASNTVLGDALRIMRERAESISGAQSALPEDAIPEPPGRPVRRCARCGGLPGEQRHEINCVYGESSPEHVAAVLGMPLDVVQKVRNEWIQRVA